MLYGSKVSLPRNSTFEYHTALDDLMGYGSGRCLFDCTAWRSASWNGGGVTSRIMAPCGMVSPHWHIALQFSASLRLFAHPEHLRGSEYPFITIL